MSIEELDVFDISAQALDEIADDLFSLSQSVSRIYRRLRSQRTFAASEADAGAERRDLQSPSLGGSTPPVGTTALRAARSAAATPDEKPIDWSGTHDAEGNFRGVHTKAPPRSEMPTRERAAEALAKAWSVSNGNCPSTAKAAFEEQREHYLDSADAVFDLFSPHVTALESALAEARKRISTLEHERQAISMNLSSVIHAAGKRDAAQADELAEARKRVAEVERETEGHRAATEPRVRSILAQMTRPRCPRCGWLGDVGKGAAADDAACIEHANTCPKNPARALEAERDAALAERDQHAADACALRMRLERAVQGWAEWRERAEKAEARLHRADEDLVSKQDIIDTRDKQLDEIRLWPQQPAPPPAAEADESRIGMRSCLKACGKYFAVSGDKEMVLMIAQALEADKAATPPAADAGTGTISVEELATEVQATWRSCTGGDHASWLAVARRAKELLGGRTPVKLPEPMSETFMHPSNLAFAQGFNEALAEVRAALAGRGET